MATHVVHINPAAASAIVRDLPHGGKSQLAMRVGISPGHLHDLLTGRRAGTDEDLRGRLADELGVSVNAISCWCDDLGRHRGESAA